MSAESVFVTAIRQCADLPNEVRKARFSYIKEHRIDQAFLSRLETAGSHPERDTDRMARLDRRRQSLSKFLERNLVCGYVRLPGVFYTIEVDPESAQVVHWEWEGAS